MPELPEVETVRRGIEARVVGRRIGEVTVGRERSVRRVGKEAVILGVVLSVLTVAIFVYGLGLPFKLFPSFS